MKIQLSKSLFVLFSIVLFTVAVNVQSFHAQTEKPAIMTFYEAAKITAADALPGDEFGFSVSFDSTTRAVGRKSLIGFFIRSAAPNCLKCCPPAVSTQVLFKPGSTRAVGRRYHRGYGDSFGESLFFADDRSVVGANWDDAQPAWAPIGLPPRDE